MLLTYSDCARIRQSDWDFCDNIRIRIGIHVLGPLRRANCV